MPISNGSGRLEFANDIAHHPLTARVIVNRIWKWHFGTGLVNTPDNFGIMGDKPSNPELVEFLAKEFVDHGESIKWLQRQILLSSVYQASVEAQKRLVEMWGFTGDDVHLVVGPAYHTLPNAYAAQHLWTAHADLIAQQAPRGNETEKVRIGAPAIAA